MSSCLALALEGFDDVEQEKRRGTAKDAVQTLIATVKGTDSNEVRGCAAEALGAMAR